ncbi:MAG: hypothetical protein QM680_08225 [Luteolibacter sp.]
MAVTVNALGVCSSVLFWMGVILCISGVSLFLAVSNGIGTSVEGHLDDTYFIIIHWKFWLLFILPVLAGFILVISGLLLRGQIPNLKAALTNSQTPPPRLPSP